MRRWCTRLAGILAGALLTVGAAAQAGPDETVVARVGAETITRGELERRLSKLPGIQLATYGATPQEIRRNFLEKVLIRERLYAQGARARKVDEQQEVRLKLQDVLRNALVSQIRKDGADPRAITADEVNRYFEANRDKFQGPERIQVWRIQLATKEEAQKLIDEVKKAGGEARWRELARERSTDKATHERGGDLGFVAPDGHSNQVSVKVDPAIYAAASKLANGEVGPEPVADGKAWSAIWRRGSQPALRRSVEQEEPAIRALLARQKLEGALKEATDKLRKDLVKEVSYDGVGMVDISAIGEVTARKRSDVGRRKALGKPQPSPGGMR